MADGPPRRLRLAPSRTRRVDPASIASALGAEEVGRVVRSRAGGPPAAVSPPSLVEGPLVRAFVRTMDAFAELHAAVEDRRRWYPPHVDVVTPWVFDSRRTCDERVASAASRLRELGVPVPREVVSPDRPGEAPAEWRRP